jgi:hypothetical protein
MPDVRSKVFPPMAVFPMEVAPNLRRSLKSTVWNRRFAVARRKIRPPSAALA